MKKNIVLGIICLVMTGSFSLKAQDEVRTPASLVNVFLGTSGDHGQLSPAASYPFSMLSIIPQTYPSIHTGYEYYAKKFLGFAHSCFEGVGCQGSGANLLVKPFLGSDPTSCDLIKTGQQGDPGYYGVQFENGIQAAFTVGRREGIHEYSFPEPSAKGSSKGLYFDLSHARANGFVGEQHVFNGNELNGWIEAGTTCSVGKYRIYYHIVLNQPVKWKTTGKHQLVALLSDTARQIELRIGWSSTAQSYATESVDQESFQDLRKQTRQAWNKALGRLAVQGLDNTADKESMRRAALFYSLLYRAIQSPYEISETNGHYQAIDGSLQQSAQKAYNGWSVWDNYRTQLPLLSLAYAPRYKDIVRSLSELYLHGKKDYATKHEPSNTVRTEHTVVVLLDAYRKGFPVDFAAIIDSVKKEVDSLDFSHPDKALESSYDTWALSQIYEILHKPALSRQYRQKALQYKKYWMADFSDLTKRDVDRMQARGMYQGTIWQYRWLVPYDMTGLIRLAGGEAAFQKQLDTFFDHDYYSQSNEPDIEAPSLYNVTDAPWKSAYLMHQYAIDTVIQYYFNDNSRGIDPVVGPVYQNRPKALLRTMDDDGGAMSSWFVFAACGLFPACVGQPVYYLHVPLFHHLKMATQSGKDLDIRVSNFGDQRVYIGKVILNGHEINQNFLTQQQLEQGGSLVIVATDKPVMAGSRPAGYQQWISAIEP